MSLFLYIFLTVLFVSSSQVIGCKDRLRNDLYRVEWGVKVYSHGRSVSSGEKFAQISKKTRFFHGDAKISSRGRYNGLMVKLSPGRVVTVRDRPHNVHEVE